MISIVLKGNEANMLLHSTDSFLCPNFLPHRANHHQIDTQGAISEGQRVDNRMWLNDFSSFLHKKQSFTRILSLLISLSIWTASSSCLSSKESNSGWYINLVNLIGWKAIVYSLSVFQMVVEGSNKEYLSVTGSIKSNLEKARSIPHALNFPIFKFLVTFTNHFPFPVVPSKTPGPNHSFIWAIAWIWGNWVLSVPPSNQVPCHKLTCPLCQPSSWYNPETSFYPCKFSSTSH